MRIFVWTNYVLFPCFHMVQEGLSLTFWRKFENITEKTKQKQNKNNKQQTKQTKTKTKQKHDFIQHFMPTDIGDSYKIFRHGDSYKILRFFLQMQLQKERRSDIVYLFCYNIHFRVSICFVFTCSFLLFWIFVFIVTLII